MRGGATYVAILILTIALSACGKYGPPVRQLPPTPPAEATEAEPSAEGAPVEEEAPVQEEQILDPWDYNDTEWDEE